MQSRDWEAKKTMEFKGTLIVVKDCRKALKFSRDMFGLELIWDREGNMELSGNMYLQEEKYWKRFTERLYPDIEYVNRLMTHSLGQRVVRFYDLGGNLIEIGTPV